MKAIILILTVGSVLTLYRLDNSNMSGLGSAPAPSIKIECSLQSVHDAPGDEPDIYAIVRFEWQATDASYVLVKGHDSQRHPLRGSFDETNGGAFTFIAVSGDQRIRKPWMCSSKYRIFTGVHGKLWDVIEKPSVAINATSDVKITTSLSKQELQDRIVQVVRTAFEVVLVPTDLSENSFGLSSDGYTDNKRLCEFDSCRKNGVDIKRQIAFDILAEIESKIGSDTKYRIRITPDVLFRVTKEGAEWNVDPNSDEIAKPILKELTENIAKLKEVAQKKLARNPGGLAARSLRSSNEGLSLNNLPLYALCMPQLVARTLTFAQCSSSANPRYKLFIERYEDRKTAT